MFRVFQPANEAPSAAQLAYSQHQFVAALFQRKVYRVVFRVHDAKETGIAEVLRASAAEENFAIEEQANVVAVAEVELLHLISIGIDVSPRIEDFHPWLWFQPLRKVVRKRHLWVRSLAISIENHKAGRLRLYVLPLDGFTLGGRERTFKISLERVVRRRQTPTCQRAWRHRRQMPRPGSIGCSLYFEIRKVGRTRQDSQRHLSFLDSSFQIVDYECGLIHIFHIEFCLRARHHQP